MRAQVSVDIIIPALAKASALMINTPPMLAYTGALLSVSGSTLTVCASDGDTTVALHISCGSETVDGHVLVPPAPLLAWLKTLPHDASVTLSSDSPTHLDAAFGSKAPYQFRTLNATFPTPPWTSTQVSGSSLSGLPAALAAVAFSAGATEDATDDVVQLVSTPSSLTLYSTDQFRVTRVELPGAGFGEHTLLLRLRTLSLVAKWQPQAVVVEPTGMVVFAIKDGLVGVRKLDSSFPPADQIVSAPAAYKTTVDTAEVLSVLHRIRALSGANEPVVVELGAETMTCSVDAETTGSGSETVQLGSSVEVPLRFGVNVDFFTQAIAALHSPTALLEWTSSTTPVRISTSSPIPVAVVVMPVRLTEG